MKLKFIFGTLVSLSLFAGSAVAHPGSKILTISGQAERTAMSAGVSFEEKNGVHLFRGGKTGAANTMLLQGGPSRRNINVEIRKEKAGFRSIRRLRSQGFYSGTAPKSRGYTQGFFADN